MANRIQFWLVRGNERLRLPVNPESISVNSPFGFEDYSVAQMGEFTVVGERGLAELSFSSFFPRDYNESFCEYSDIPKPWDAVKQIEKWRNDRKPARFTVTGTAINYPVLIRDFSYEPERAGNPGDIYFSIQLKEYRHIELVDKKKGAQKVKAVAETRPTTKTPPKTYTVKSGDSLYKIAARVYKDGNQWRKIYDEPSNKKTIGKNPNLTKAGQKLVIP